MTLKFQFENSDATFLHVSVPDFQKLSAAGKDHCSQWEVLAGRASEDEVLAVFLSALHPQNARQRKVHDAVPGLQMKNGP